LITCSATTGAYIGLDGLWSWAQSSQSLNLTQLAEQTSKFFAYGEEKVLPGGFLSSRNIYSLAYIRA
jgi:hypothetical protein